MASDPIQLDLLIKTEKAKAALKDLGVFNNAEINRMTANVSKGFKEQERAAKEAANVFKTSVNDLKGASQKVGSAVGGAFGGATAQIANLAEGLFGIAGPAGLAAAAVVGIGVAAAAAFGAMDSLAESTRAAVARLEEIDGAEKAPIAVGQALADWDQQTLRLEASTALTTTQLATGLLPAAAGVLEIVNNSISGYQKAAAALEPYRDDMATFARVLQGIVSLGFSELIRDNGEAATATAADFIDLTKITVALTQEEIALGLAYGTLADPEAEAEEAAKKLADAKREAAEAARDHAAAMAESARALAEEQAATDTLNASIRDSTADQLTAADKIEQAYNDRVKAIKAAAAASQDVAAADIALSEAEARRDRELNALNDDLLAERQQVEFEADQVRRDWRNKENAEKIEALKTFKAMALATTLSTLDATVGLIDQAIAANEGQTEAERKSARTAFAARQGLATSSVLLSGITAFMGLLNTFAPLGPFAPVAAFAIAGPATATSLAQIASTPAPEFPDGGLIRRPQGMSADHFPIAAEEGEMMANRRNVRRNGQAIEAGNAGATIGGGGPAQIVNRYRHREFNAIVADNLRLPGPLSRKFDRIRPPGRRR